MATIRRFEDIEAWKRGRELRKRVYQITARGHFARDFGLRDQIRRSALSVTANIAEGFERAGRKEFIQFLAHSKGSCGELRDQLYAALDEGYISQQEFQELYEMAAEIGRLLSGFMKYLQTTTISGSKFKPTSQQNFKP